MLVVEGPDGGGKTTLIKLLSEELGLPVAPRVVSQGTEAMVDLKDWVDNNLEEGFQPVIFDRYRLISEPIYGPILRDQAQPGFDDITWLGPRIKRFYDLDPIIIYCLPSYDLVEDNVISDPNNAAVKFDIAAIYSAYVAKAAMDLAIAPGTVKVWDYHRSPTIKGKPSWLHSVGEQIKARTQK